jgi:hypothetical protein
MQQRIEKFNAFVMQQDIDKIPVGLFCGKTGLSIYFYHQALICNDKKYEHFAGKLLDSVYRQVHDASPVDLEKGLTGICAGILYLIENGFVKGNPNYVLKDLDDKIFSELYFNLLNEKQNVTLRELKAIVHSALYFCKRLADSGISLNEKELLEQIIIRAINRIEIIAVTVSDTMSEPFLFSPFDYFPALYFTLIHRVYELGFYAYKVQKVCDEWTDRLLSTMPLLKSHRLLLAAAMENVNRYCNLPQWKEHINLLRYNIDIETTIQTDFRNKNLSIMDGLAGFYLFLQENSLLTDGAKKLVSGRIADSEVWMNFDKGDDNKKLLFIGLTNGLPGAIQVYLKTGTEL